LLLVFLRFLADYTMSIVGQRVMFDLRVSLFQHLQRMPFSFYDRNPVGRLVTRITNDVEALNELFSSGFVTLFADFLVLAGITVLLLWRNVTLALVTLSVLPCLLLVTAVFRDHARRFYREQRGHLAHLGAFTQEAIQGMDVNQLFHRERRTQEEYEHINALLTRAFKKSVMAYSVYFPVVETLGKCALAAIIWQASRQIAHGESTYGDFYLFWICLERFFQPIRDIAERYNVLQSAMAAAERIFKVLDTPESIVRVEPEDGRDRCRGVPPSARGRVEFRNVWFAYQGEEFVLKDVSFAVEPGKTVAIVGATGGGKSTIINLMSRFYDPQRGTIEIDGVDVRFYEKQALRRRIGVVLQDVFLFSRSIRDNIRLGETEISPERVEECARVVNADHFIRRLGAGYDQVLTERGGSLSVGEKQLLAFARALVHTPDFLVLDEATAHVDTETERLIQDALGKLFQGRTSIVIAHRLSTVRRADRIIVLHKGEIREEGTHSELIGRRGIYWRLHELEYRG
jgi:ABC-type multidrug transport system fused ATPase/permease subunit